MAGNSACLMKPVYHGQNAIVPDPWYCFVVVRKVKPSNRKVEAGDRAIAGPALAPARDRNARQEPPSAPPLNSPSLGGLRNQSGPDLSRHTSKGIL
jgi:hypothetical protein